jgi:hypothetical protein
VSTGFQYQYAITSHHIICFSDLVSETIIEVFPLPRVAVQPNNDTTIPSLTRSHKSLHNRPIFRVILLTERHEPHDNNSHPSVHYTFVTTSLGEEFTQLGFLDISLASDSATTTWTYAAEIEGQVCTKGSSRAGVCRLLGRPFFNGKPIAITVSEDGDGERVVRSRFIVMDKQQEEVFDGVHGRMCFRVSPAQITVVSFV